eukprot:TRINITY_DN26820_c0_g2_i2.p1 TRINITY_DN26820_c0_g2~~TRINITY_DN26820_c0_g2_i2.p1  ORF type:complete len:675 (-),score=119.98 TRINITY_DN26820_c0_g2_i2:128-2152(-)
MLASVQVLFLAFWCTSVTEAVHSDHTSTIDEGSSSKDAELVLAPATKPASASASRLVRSERGDAGVDTHSHRRPDSPQQKLHHVGGADLEGDASLSESVSSGSMSSSVVRNAVSLGEQESAGEERNARSQSRLKWFDMAHCQRFDSAGEPLYVEKIPGSARCLAGVPIYNFHWAFPDSASLAEQELHKDPVKKPFIAMFPKSYTDTDMVKLCDEANKQVDMDCIEAGHPTEGGTPSLELNATLESLQNFLVLHPTAAFVEPDKELELEPESNGDASKSTALAGASCMAQRTLDYMNGLEAPSSWGLDRVDNYDNSPDCRSLISNPEVEGTNVSVWIMDTGVNIEHNDFEGRANAGIDATLKRTLTDCRNVTSTTCSRDVDGHGSHCAGTVGGKIYGLAKGVTLYSAKVLGDDKSGRLNWIVSGLDYIAKWFEDNGKPPTVISMSLASKGVSVSLNTALEGVVSKGIVVIVAAGNAAEDACDHTPANSKSVITVGATTSDDTFASYSNYGPCVDILAPGSDIVSVGPSGADAEHTDSGTSMACPHVSAAAAMVLSTHPELLGPSAQAKVLEKLKSVAIKDMIQGVKGDTPNLFLNVVSFVKPPNQKKERLAIVVGASSVALILVVALAYYFLCRGDKKKKGKKGQAAAGEAGQAGGQQQPQGDQQEPQQQQQEQK